MAMKISFRSLVLIAFCLSSPSIARSVERPVADLIREADQVLAIPDNVARRAGIAPVFKLAQQYATQIASLSSTPSNLSCVRNVRKLLQNASARKRNDQSP